MDDPHRMDRELTLTFAQCVMGWMKHRLILGNHNDIGRRVKHFSPKAEAAIFARWFREEQSSAELHYERSLERKVERGD